MQGGDHAAVTEGPERGNNPSAHGNQSQGRPAEGEDAQVPQTASQFGATRRVLSWGERPQTALLMAPGVGQDTSLAAAFRVYSGL